MPQNDFLPFALGASPNITAQAIYAALAARSSGFQSGVAQSDQVNKVLRQAAFIGAMVAQFTADQANLAMLDNGDLPGAEANFLAAITHVVQTVMGSGGFAGQGALAAEIAARILGDNNEATARGQADGNEAAIRAAADTSEANQRTQDVAALYSNYQSADQSLLNTFNLYARLTDFGSGTGFQRMLSGGTVLQWGNGVTTTGNQDYTAFPVAFPSVVQAVIACENSAAGWSATPSPTVYGTTLLNNSAFHISVAVFNGGLPPAYSGGKGFSFIALGR